MTALRIAGGIVAGVIGCSLFIVVATLWLERIVFPIINYLLQ